MCLPSLVSTFHHKQSGCSDLDSWWQWWWHNRYSYMTLKRWIQLHCPTCMAHKLSNMILCHIHPKTSTNSDCIEPILTLNLLSHFFCNCWNVAFLCLACYFIISFWRQCSTLHLASLCIVCHCIGRYCFYCRRVIFSCSIEKITCW